MLCAHGAQRSTLLGRSSGPGDARSTSCGRHYGAPIIVKAFFLASRRRGLAAQVAHFRPRQGRLQATDYREAYRLQATGTKLGAGYSQHPGPPILFIGFASCSSCQSVSERRPESGGLHAELGFTMAAVRNGSRERFVRAAVAGTAHSSWTPGTKIKNRKIANLLTNIVRPGGPPLVPACRPC